MPLVNLCLMPELQLNGKKGHPIVFGGINFFISIVNNHLLSFFSVSPPQQYTFLSHHKHTFAFLSSSRIQASTLHICTMVNFGDLLTDFFKKGGKRNERERAALSRSNKSVAGGKTSNIFGCKEAKWHRRLLLLHFAIF